jgi:K+-transporting ATPase ATPase C chain
MYTDHRDVKKNSAYLWGGTLRAALVALAAMTLVTGLLYPVLVTVAAQVLFPGTANGSLIRNAAGEVIGSALIGQEFERPEYFWGRPSATGPHPYNAAASTGANLGPLNPALIGPQGSIQKRVDALAAADSVVGVVRQGAGPGGIPADLVTASASGLDPHISPAAARYQAPRVAAARGIAVEVVEALVAELTEGRTLGILGEPRVNVLQLNLALDVQTR